MMDKCICSAVDANRFQDISCRGVRAVALLLASLSLMLSHKSAAQDTGPTNHPIPHLIRVSGGARLIVDGQPWLIRGGELGNSSASHRDYLKPYWTRLVQLNLNTVLAPVYWDLVEPEEGRFDFSLVDGLIEDARQHDLRLVLLWFGTWKNSMSCYAPEWVKRDQQRFPRCQTSDGVGLEILSPFSNANVKSDSRAFVELMRHLRRVDGQRHTVIMVQVENEIGMIPEARDHSPAATELFRGPVPSELTDYLEKHKDSLVPEFREMWKATDFTRVGSWEQCFGPGAHCEELFMAWHFARYANRLAELGKAEYPLPMFANAALVRPGYVPGQYPSAGPLPHLMDVWRAAAPALDFLAPDIYFPNFVEWCEKYDRSGNPLFVPEASRDPQSAANALYAIGQHSALGFSPFSIESIDDPQNHPLRQSYQLIEQLTPLVFKHQGQGTMAGVAPRVPFDEQEIPTGQTVRLGGYELTVTFEPTNPWASPQEATPQKHPVGGILFSTGPDEFLIAGTGLVVTFAPHTPGDPLAGIAHIREGRFVEGRWTPGRWLNGDQSHQGRHLRIPAGQWDIQRVKLYRYR